MSSAISQTDNFFIQILSDRLNQRKTTPVSNIDWDRILQLIHSHNLEGIVFNQCKMITPQEFKNKILVGAMLCFRDFQQKAQTIAAIDKIFTESNIEFLIIKGWEVAQFYPAAKERSMGDIDLVVRTNDRDAAKKALENIGFRNTKLGLYDWEFKKDYLVIELHSHLQYEKINTDTISFEYTESIWNHTKRKESSSKLELDWNFHLVFLLLHLRKHFIEGGVGAERFSLYGAG